MDLSGSVLERLLARRAAPDPVPLAREHLLALARDNRLLPTLASAWEAEGATIEDALSAEIRTHRERADRLRSVERSLADAVGAPLTVLKGRHVAAHYPPAWVRGVTDLDLEVADAGTVIELARLLEDWGWAVTGVTVFADDGRLRLAVDAVRRGPRHGGDDLVQIQGFSYLGTGWTVSPVADDPGLTRLTAGQRSLVELAGVVAKRGRVVGRDILDCHLLTSREDVTPVPAAVARLGIAPEWTRLRDETSRAFSDSAPLASTSYPPAGEAGAGTTRRNEADIDPAVHNTAWLFSHGYPLSGEPVPGSPRVSAFAVRDDGEGRFSFVGPFGAGPLTSLVGARMAGKRPVGHEGWTLA